MPKTKISNQIPRIIVWLFERFPYIQSYFNLNNITDAMDRNLYQGTIFPNAEQFYGKTLDIGLRYRL